MLSLLLALFAVGVLMPSPMHLHAYAQAAEGDPGTGTSSDATTETKTTGGSVTKCDDLPEAQGGVLIGKIVPCLVHTIQESTQKFTQEMISWLSPLLYTFLLLVVVFYGIRVLQKEPEVYKQGFLLLVKIAIVSTILSDLGNTQAYDGSGSGGKLIPAVYGVMNDTQAIVAGAITTTNLHCDVSKYKGDKTPQVWAMMDCVMGKLWGFTKGGDGKPSMLLVTSVAGLLTGFLFGGAWGVAVFFGMVAVLFTMFMLVIRTIVGFLIGYLIVCLMLILSPLFLPLAFLRGTAPFFDNFWRTILRAILTPVIITAYSMFALLVYDKMLFAPDSIVQKLFDYNEIKDALQPSKKPCNREVTGDPVEIRLDTKPSDAERDTLFSVPGLENLSMPTLSGGNDACNFMKVPVFKMNQMGGATEGKEKDDLTKIFMELVNLFLLAYLISAGQEILPTIVSQLVGGAATITGTKAVTDAGGKYSAAFSNARNSAMRAFQKIRMTPILAIRAAAIT